MRTDPARFDRVVSHPEFASAPTEPVMPADAAGIAEMVTPLVVSMIGLVILLIALGLLVDIGPPLAFTVLFVGMALVVILGALGHFGKALQFRNAPVARVIAVIVKERTEVSGGGENSPASTTYYATLQTRDGKRTEYVTYRSLVGRLAIDDIGVAYVKAYALVEFIRFEVD